MVTAFLLTHWLCHEVLTCHTHVPLTMCCLLQVRKVAGMFLYCLQQAAKGIRADDENPHRKRILEDEEFYQNWLYPRFKRFYSQRGWRFDSGIAAKSSVSSQLAECKTTGKSSRLCVPFRMKARRKGKLFFWQTKRKQRQDDKGITEVPQPPVGFPLLNNIKQSSSAGCYLLLFLKYFPCP